MNTLLLSTFALTTYTDIKWYKVYNWIMYPALGLALLQTYNVLQVVLAYAIMAILLSRGILRWSGGDVKLFMLIASIKGLMFIPVIALTDILMTIYRRYTGDRKGLPVTPFAFISLLITMSLAVALKKIGFEWVA